MDLATTEVRYRDYTLILTAGVPQSIAVSGDYWQLIDTAVGEITIDLDETVTIVRDAPCGGPGNYRRVTLTSATDQKVVLALGYTNGLVPYDNRTIVRETIKAIETTPTGVEDFADLTIAAGGTDTFPANANRDTIVITLDDAAPGYVRVVSSGASNGARLYPGGALSLRTTASITVRNPNGVAVTVSATGTTV